MAQLIGLIVVLALTFGPARQIIAGLCGVFVFLVMAGVVIAFALSMYKPVSRPRTPGQEFSFQISPPAPAASQPPRSLSSKPSFAGPHTTDELIERLRSIDWFQFEQMVELVYRKQGYAVNRRGGAKPDGGIDLVLDKNGERTAVQCKHWKTWNVGVKAVREFLGALTDAGIKRGMFITLGGYTREAKQLADKHGIELVNETGLARLLEATDARFDQAALEILRDTRKLCPKCEREMVLRTASKGRGAGKEFWGCSGFPKCRCTLQA